MIMTITVIMVVVMTIVMIMHMVMRMPVAMLFSIRHRLGIMPQHVVLEIFRTMRMVV